MSSEKLTITELKAQVKNYIDYMVGKNMKSDEFFLAATINKEALRKITDSYPDCTGVRIYLTKETLDGSGDIWPLIVPVRHDADGIVTDLMKDEHAFMASNDMSNFDCRNPPCTLRNQGNILLP
ncbi:hypothetical protein [Spirosoma luteum]|uniref:hypothetical protein n=1 Tax=Spirosoma luteum TaxID=431553 RepID=UPI000363DFF3|nr:hypothetical protein [Spirosoma luteum]